MTLVEFLLVLLGAALAVMGIIGLVIWQTWRWYRGRR